MKYLKRNQINDLAWNACIEHSTPSFIQAFTWYLDVICANWDALVLEEDGKYLACFPIPWKKKLGIKYVYPPYFAQQLGLFSISKMEPEPFLAEMQKRFKFIEQYLNFYGTPSGKEKCNLILPLNDSYANLYQNFSSNHKKSVQKSLNGGLILQKSNDFNVIIDLFRKNRGKNVKNLKKRDYQVFRNCCERVAEQNKLHLVHAYDEAQNLLAGAVFFVHQNRITFVFSGLSEAGKKSRALFLIIKQIINEHQNSDFILDFEGSENSGIRHFYQDFGAIQQNYYFYRVNALPFPFNRLKR